MLFIGNQNSNYIPVFQAGKSGNVSSAPFNAADFPLIFKNRQRSPDRLSVLANNIANADTPGYKRKDVQFETYLSNAVAGTDSLDETVANLDLNDLNATVYNEQPGLSYRSDGNNVDVSTENVELAKNQIKYYTLMNSISQEFSRMKSALKTS